MNKLILTAILVCAICNWQDSMAEPLFEDHGLIELELAGPLHTLIKSGDDKVERPFLLRANGQEHKVMVRLRGKSRLKVCDFPPLRIRFDSQAPATGIFAGQEKLKLVTHCHNSDKGDQNVLEEYTAYRLFALLSPQSYRVRLFSVTYTDTDGKLTSKASPRFAFVIESMAELAQRSGGEPFRTTGLSKSQINLEQVSRVYVFQYMIGNTDWSLVLAEDDDACCHNGDLLRIDGSVYVVPYDFDLAGIVNARYAKPDREMRIKNVRQRRYRGYCTDPAEVAAALQYIKSREGDIRQMVNSIPGLSDKGRSVMIEYLGAFFEKAQDEDKLLRLFDKGCIG